MRRTLLPLGIVLMVVLAGCSGLGGSETQTASPETGSPTSDSSDPSNEPLDNPRAALSWLTDSGVNETALLRAHALTVNNESSYTTRATSRRIATDGPGETVARFRLAASTTQQRARYSVDRTLTNGSQTRIDNRTQYREVVDGTETLYVRTETSSGVDYRVREPFGRNFSTFYRQSTGYDQTFLVRQFELSYDQPVQRNGRTLYRLTSDSFAEGTSFAASASNASATVLVSERGVIRSLEYSYDGTSGGTPLRVTYTFEATALGETTVERPDWIDEAQ